MQLWPSPRPQLLPSPTGAGKPGFASALPGRAFPCRSLLPGAEPPGTAWPSLSPVHGNRRDRAKSRPCLSLKAGSSLDAFQICTYRLRGAFVVTLVTTAHPPAAPTPQSILQLQSKARRLAPPLRTVPSGGTAPGVTPTRHRAARRSRMREQALSLRETRWLFSLA